MEKTALEQEREIKDVIRRAKGIPDKTGSLRRETLKRLIDLIHSPHSNLKILAAQNIRFFFNDFPELEEVAINAVYDLCEDQSSKVRIEGYTAITQVSRTENKWVKRNADVLLQLLQSDEPDEVIVVKKALTEHLDMDPRVTLGVLCDQIIPPEELMDEEEQTIRDRLRSLVLSFLNGEAKRAIVERHAIPGSIAEDVLINCLLEAIPKLPLSDVETVVKNLLLSLNAYQPGSPRGHTLLQVLLDKTASDLRNGLRSGTISLLQNVRMYVDLVTFLVVEKRTAPAIQLLRFFCGHLSSRMTLQKFPTADQASIICNISETFVVANEVPQPLDEGQPLDALRKQIINACPLLLECLHKHGLPNKRFVDACTILLRACIRRKEESPWSPPPHLITVLRDIQVHSNRQDVQVLIRVRSGPLFVSSVCIQPCSLCLSSPWSPPHHKVKSVMPLKLKRRCRRTQIT
ncbi:hypothetical protein BDZ94DRAFT_820535 [Collybia nuda]|uniref:Apoptosis inhibitor 5 n=1 Tax=Collybia nuda TaxID=64659 RepID=A0A9P5Y2V0_9AGAR|nr:hypothetical protein BDZ94DRAFT_820535 [Collybia nuda]